MRNFNKIILLTVTLLLLFVISCSNDNDPLPTTGDLYNKPLPVIKASIQGRWQLHYGKGGFIANQVHDWGNDDYWEFDFKGNTDRIKAYDEPITADATITWVKGQDNYAGKTYIMNLNDKYGYPINLATIGIYNDTLVIKDFADDAIFYYFTKP